MFSNDADYRISDRIALANGRTDPLYVRLSTRTDRHQFMLQGTTSDACAITVAHPDSGSSGPLDFADPSTLGASEWVKPPGYATNTITVGQGYTVSFYGKYAKLAMPGGGLTADALLVYRPVPPTSP